jgi:Galactose oxidase, central domain
MTLLKNKMKYGSLVCSLLLLFMISSLGQMFPNQSQDQNILDNKVSHNYIRSSVPILPTSREFASINFDPISGLTYLFGGKDNSGPCSDLWSYNSTNKSWNLINPTCPLGPLEGPLTTYDPIRQLLVVYGGNNGTDVTNDLWYYNISSNSWVYLNIPTGSRPLAAYRGAMCYDPILDGYIIAGGGYYDFQGYHDQCFIFYPVNNTWADLVQTPGERADPRMIYDPILQTPIFFGGQSSGSTKVSLIAYNHITKAWAPITSTGDTVFVQYYYMTYDPDQQKTVIFNSNSGGTSQKMNTFNSSANIWAEITSTNSVDVGNNTIGLTYNTVADKLLYFGDLVAGGSIEVWGYSYTNNNWTIHSAAGDSTPGAGDTSSDTSTGTSWDSSTGTNTDSTGTNTVNLDDIVSSPYLWYIIGAGVVIIFGITVLVMKKKKSKVLSKDGAAQISDPDAITPELEKQLLGKFKSILNMSQKVPVSSVADNLEVSEKVLFAQLIKWNKTIPFKIDGDMIVVDNLSDFVTALDGQFDEWQERDITKEGKIE